MNGAARETVAAATFVAIGVAVSLAVALPGRVAANPDPGVSYVWRGTNPSGQYCYPWSTLPGHHPCWHDDETAGEYTAIDYSYPGVSGDEVWLEYTGDSQLFKMLEFPPEYPCTGIRAGIYQGSYNQQNYRGDIHYIHIDPNDYWFNREVPYQPIYIGDVSATQPGCLWDAPHLHQSARVSAETPFYTNKLGDPTQDNEWVHAIMWESGTSDNDGDTWGGLVWSNETELYIGTDPFDRCSDNSSDPAWPLDINNDRAVTVPGDVFSYYNRIGSAVGGEPTYWHRLDLNADGFITYPGDLNKYAGKLGSTCFN
jgi:hypothetical protein